MVILNRLAQKLKQIKNRALRKGFNPLLSVWGEIRTTKRTAIRTLIYNMSSGQSRMFLKWKENTRLLSVYRRANKAQALFTTLQAVFSNNTTFFIKRDPTTLLKTRCLQTLIRNLLQKKS